MRSLRRTFNLIRSVSLNFHVLGSVFMDTIMRVILATLAFFRLFLIVRQSDSQLTKYRYEEYISRYKTSFKKGNQVVMI